MKKILAIILIMIYVPLLFACSAKKTISFGTGNIGGNYHTYGNVLSQLINSDDESIICNMKNTQGSAANIRLMQKGFLDMAIAQSDTLSDAETDNIRAIAGLYTEECQVVVKADSDIQKIADLYGKKVSLGESESGVRKNAEQILFVNGLSTDVIEEQYLSFADSASALENGSIDAFFCTSAAPTGTITELAKNMEIRLLSLDDRTIERLLKDYKGYTECIIPVDTYQNQNTEIHTIGVKAVLIASKNLDNTIANQVLETLFNHSSELRYATITGELDIDFATTDIPIPFHEGVAGWYSTHNTAIVE